MSRLFLGIILSSIIINFSCQRRLFKTKNLNPANLTIQATHLNRNQKIEKFDHLAFSLFSRKGEPLLDPEGLLDFNRGKQDVGMMNQQQTGIARELFPLLSNSMRPLYYIVSESGEIDFPAIGKVKVEGLTLLQADSLLSREYHEKGFYLEAFVKTQYLNKRVILLGVLGDRVIKLNNENMTVFEVIAQQNSQNLQSNSNSLQNSARSIVIIRNLQNNPKNMQVEEINLYDLAALNSKDISVKNGDIIYIAPRRRLDRDAISDISFFTASITSLATLYLLYISIAKRP